MLLHCAAALAAPPAEGAPPGGDLPPVFEGLSYASLGPVRAAHIPSETITIDVHTYASASGVSVLDHYLDRAGPILALEGGYVTYTVEIPRDGRYGIELHYAAMPGSRANIELSVEIDGVVPFREVQVCQFQRFWRYSGTERTFDNRGNMLRPSSEEAFLWRSAYFTDKEGFHNEPFAFFLPAGTREITLRSVREPVALGGIRLTPPPSPVPYAELAASYDPNDIAGAGPVTVLAVDASLRNSSSVLPIVDLTNPYLEPFSLSTISYNTMGGDMWCLPGQMIAWELEIPSDGLYALSFVYRQDAVVGLPVTRTLKINGEVPFAEAGAVVFPYNSNWQRLTLRVDGEEALVYLTEGVHEISLTVTLGPTADVCRRVSEISSELSALYTQIIMVTGPYPDHMRDYRIDARLPDIMPRFAELAARLDEVSADITALGAGRNDALSVSVVAAQLHDFAKRPDSIPGRLARFKDNIINLAIWVLMASEMPLTLYSVSIAPPGTEFGPHRPGFFRSILFFFQRFFSSFTSRAENAGNSYNPDEENLIEVWGMYGMDASELLKRLIDEEFTPQTGIKVNYNIIFNENLMFFNIAAQTGPDVCLNILKGYPLDFGLRGAAADLAALPEYDKFEALFPQTSMLPNSWGGKVYGFPVIQQIPVMFVRNDIFNDLGLSIPDTWDEFYSIIGELGVRNLQVSPAGDLMPLFVLQRGGTYFNEDLSASILDGPIGIEALTEWTNLFTLHGAPVQSDFFNRFRTGEMPIGINDYSLYNMLDYAALEIKGDWGMYPVPGIEREDGTVDRTIITSAGAANAIASTSGFITTSRPERLDDSWEFVRWFMSEETQVRFALELEAMFGPAARLNTANMAAQASLNWDRHSYDTIMASLSNIREIPGVPGAYYIGRHIGNAFNEIVLMGEPPRTAMRKYAEVINAEIMRKRIELGLEG
jgi:ABC-type glycerol-3-phosphate transport system substrate-binding protein